MELANIHRLLVFEQVAGALSMSRAAERLMVSQPAVSRQVRELEALVGVPLFDRLGRRLALTDAGEALVSRTRALRDLLADMEDEMSGITSGVAGSLKLGASTVWEYLLPPWMGSFQGAHGRVGLALAVGNTHQTISLMLRHEIHLGFVGERPREMELEAMFVMDDEIIVVGGPGCALASAGPVRPAALNKAAWVQRESDSATARFSVSYLKGLGVDRQPSMELGSNEALKEAVRAGTGIGMISRYAVMGDLASGALTHVRLQAPPCTRPLYALRNPARFFSPAQRAFLDHVRQSASAAACG